MKSETYRAGMPGVATGGSGVGGGGGTGTLGAKLGIAVCTASGAPTDTWTPTRGYVDTWTPRRGRFTDTWTPGGACWHCRAMRTEIVVSEAFIGALLERVTNRCHHMPVRRRREQERRRLCPCGCASRK